MHSLNKFCFIVRQRSQENTLAVQVLANNGLSGQVVSVLRQELDSMVRVIFLLNKSTEERIHLINLTLAGLRWRLLNNSIVTDKQMVELADNLNGWTNSVYKFGCAFIHLSSYHNYIVSNPFETLDIDEINAIKTHLHNYHSFPLSANLTMQSIAPYLPKVFDKITSNLSCYIHQLEEGETRESYLL